LTADPPRLLRPGLVTPAEIEVVVGPIQRAEDRSSGSVVRSPGMLAKHYAPRAPLEVADDDGRSRVEGLIAAGQHVGWLTWPEADGLSGVVCVRLPRDPTTYAAGLYAALHDLDDRDVERIVVAQPPNDETWLAVRDRLHRAAH
jgi:L-threonylcarbamoyladenylate synthase